MEVSQVRAAVVIILLLLFNTLTTWYKVILIPETLPFNLTSRSRSIHCDGSWCKEFPSSFRTLRVPLSNKCCEHFFFFMLVKVTLHETSRWTKRSSYSGCLRLTIKDTSELFFLISWSLSSLTFCCLSFVTFLQQFK